MQGHLGGVVCSKGETLKVGHSVYWTYSAVFSQIHTKECTMKYQNILYTYLTLFIVLMGHLTWPYTEISVKTN